MKSDSFVVLNKFSNKDNTKFYLRGFRVVISDQGSEMVDFDSQTMLNYKNERVNVPMLQIFEISEEQYKSIVPSMFLDNKLTLLPIVPGRNAYGKLCYKLNL